MINASHHTLTIPSYALGSGEMITAKSFLLDRIVPACGILNLPPKTVVGGEVQVGFGLKKTNGAVSGKPPLKHTLRRIVSGAPRPIPALDGSTCLDFRVHSPQNWAHFLNYHLPFFFKLCEMVDLAQEDLLVLLPENTPSYITHAAQLFGMRVTLSDAPAPDQSLGFDMPHWTVLRPARFEWVRSPKVTQRIAEIETQVEKQTLPQRVFLSRRDTRALINEIEVAGWLKTKGFETIYPEDLSPAAQIALFRNASAMVAIHGAGLAPLLYRDPNAPPLELVELLPCGHMTDVYRVMSQQVGAKWIGVQGRLKPEYIRHVYQFEQPFLAHSLDVFELDLDALKISFEHMSWA